MNFFLKGILRFILPIILYCIVAITALPTLLSIQNGPTTKEQITLSFDRAISRDYELLVLGNSRIYSGVNPDKFDFSTYNFSHDDDSYNQIYYKLDFLVRNKKKFNYLILGMDYFQFSFKSDLRNYVYADFLPKEYLEDFGDVNVLKLKLKYHLSNTNPKKLTGLRPKSYTPFLRENGQYLFYGTAKESDSISRDISRLSFQEHYFDKIIDLCKAQNVIVFMVMPPTRANELTSYTQEQMEEFDAFVEKYQVDGKVFYLNYSTKSDFQLKDYRDITHLNEVAADRFSKILNDDITKLLNTPAE